MTKIEQQGDMSPGSNGGSSDEFPERPWIVLKTTHDVEAWIDHYNWDLQQCVKKTHATGYGVCFVLGEGGEIFMHTTEGAVLLDVTPEAEWVAPVISAATGIEAPDSQIWILPDDRLTQLVLGLSSLIASTRIVVSHRYKTQKY